MTEQQSALFQRGDFRLHSGSMSHFKIDCDALTDADIQALAAELAAILPPFGAVYGVPRGGLRLADALRLYTTSGPRLIVDDVLTTGQSMNEARALFGYEVSIGAVLFTRMAETPGWITPLFRMTPGREL